MPPFPQGSFIKNKDGERKKILGECGEVRFVSFNDRMDGWETHASNFHHIQELIRGGWVEEQPEWRPECGEQYWWFGDRGDAAWGYWRDNGIDCSRLAFRNVFPSREACEAAVKARKDGK